MATVDLAHGARSAACALCPVPSGHTHNGSREETMTQSSRQNPAVTIRWRLPADDNAISRLNDATFGGTAEARLIANLRAAGLAVIELVAVDRGEIVGHVLFSRLAVASNGHPVETLALAP